MPIISGSGSGSAGVGSVGGLVEETRRLLFQNSKSEFNFLNEGAELSASDTTLTFADPLGGIVAGAYISIDDEVMYVRSTSGSDATVVRGMLGTTADTHDDGSIVEVQPRWPKPFIKDALKREIDSWPEDLFQVDNIDITASDSYWGQGIDLDIPGDWYYILDVRHTPDTISDTQSSLIYNDNWPSVRYFELLREAPTTDFASGTALIINERVPSGTVRVIYAKPFDTSIFGDDADLNADIGMPPSMFDIPPLGAAWRLLSGSESPRSDMRAQGVSRRSNEVPATYQTQTSRSFEQQRDRRIDDESRRLLSKYPVRHT